MSPEDTQFLQYVQAYVTENPAVAAYVSDYAAYGIEASRKTQAAKSADMEGIIAFLLRGGKLKASEKEFVAAKLEKWDHFCALNWSSLIKEWKK